LRATRGAGFVDYALVLVLIAGVASVAANAFATAPESTLRYEGACVKSLACEKAHASSSSRSLAPQERQGAAAAWEGVRSEASIAATELEGAARSPGDVLRGVTFLVDHPGVAMKALLERNAGRPAANGAPEPDGAEGGGRAAARIATLISPASLGRLAKIGAMVGRHGTIDWDLPDAPMAPDDPLGPSPTALTNPPRSGAGQADAP
jgi:hypothetical protein